MNLDSLSITLSQISYLVKNLSKRNYKSSVQELTELVSTHGQEADSYLLRCLLSEIDLNSDAVRAPNNKDFQQVQLLTQECTVLLRKPALVSLLVNAVDKSVQNNKIKNPAQLLPTLSKILKLTPVQEVVFGLTLLHSSYQVVSESALYFIKQKLPILIKNYSSEDTRHKEGGLHDTTPEVLHFILSDLFFPKEKTFLGISLETKELLLSSLRRDFSKELVPVVLAPLLYSDIDYNFKMDKISQEPGIMTSNLIDDSLHTLIREVGYAFCSTLEDGRQQMSTLGMRDLSASGVARILIMMVRTCSGIDEVSCPTFWANSEHNSEKLLDNSSQTKGWNMEVFTQVLKEFNPNLSWIEVIRELDNADLVIRERKALSLLFTALRLGLQHQGFHPEQFPIEVLYRRWKHPEAQLSLISQIIKNPDIFCFADYTYHSVSIDMLKVTPEIDNKEIATWRSLNLLEVLLYLADRGLASQVQDLLKFPIQHCADILFLGLVQINQNMTIYRQELITNMLPLFLTNHPNSSVILHQAWNSQTSGIRQIITHYMAEWYLRAENDQTRLSRILDIAHDLKALAHLLNLQTFPFIIDLACLAARREYLKLDKWLTDKIREYGEGFVASLLKVLQRRCPQLFGSSYKEEIYPKAPPLPQDTVVTIINCLQACVGNLSPETNETVLSLITNCNFLVNKSRQAPSNVFRSHRNLEQSFNPPMFPSGSSQVDPLINLGSTMNNLNLNGPQTNNNAFNLPAGIGPLGSNPGSPSRLISPSQNTGFTLLPQMNGMNAQVNHVPSSLVNNSITSINSLAHIAPQSNAIEKLRLNETPSAANMIEFNSQVTKEIEDEANGYFQRIFNHPPQSALSPEEVIELLKKLHSSPNKRDRELFVCMIRNLFEECKFFYQYPDKELYITAQLFGGILAHGLLSQSPLFGTGLKYILDALRKPAHSKMFSFGVGALDQLKPMLKDIPKLCDFIMKLPSFQELPSTLIEYVEYGVQGQEPPHKAVSSNVSTLLSSPLFKTSMSANNSTNSSPVTKITANSRPSIANATNIDTLLVATEKDEKIIMPPETLQEKVAFIFNNLSQLNIQTKGDEIKDLIREDHFGWLAQYMVMKRASIEANFHGLYSNFLDTLKLLEFDRLVLSETYRNIRVLLRCDKTTANFSDRTLLKNLGHWLGMITIAKHKPVLMDDLDVRMLLVESQKKGSQEMLYVVPFVAKILDSCIRSKIFKPPNPWTMSIVCLLAEIHQLPQLKLNLKFEIEVLLKSLQLDLATVKNTNYLKEGVLVENMEHQLSNKPKTHTPSPASTPVMTQALTPSSQNSAASSVILSSAASSTSVTPSLVNNPPPTNEEIIMQMAQLPLGNTSAVAGTSNNLLTPVAPAIPEPKYNLTTFNISTVSSLGALVSINGQLPLFQNFPSLKQYVRPVFERCLQEWIGPVTDRSTRISLNTTELIIKGDFALDPDETRMRLASHYLARNLTAGLSMVTTREQIMHSFTLNLKSTMMNILMKTEGFQQYTNLQQKELVDQAVDASVGDNIDLVCAFVQKTAMDRAVVEIDRRLHNEYEKRKSARMEGRRYCDSHVLTYQAERMPEQVRLKVGGVGQQQMIVYDEFAKKIPGFQVMTDRDIAIFASNNKQIVAALGTNDDMPLYDKLTSDLEMCLQSMTMQGILANNSSQSNYIHTIVELLTTLKRNGSRDTITAVSVIQKCIEGLLDCITQSTTDPEFGMRYRDFYMRTLKVFQDSKTFGLHWTNKTATRILVEYREEYRFNLEIVDLLARVHLLYFPLYDAHLAQSMENGLNFVAVAFAMQLLQYYLVDRKGSVRLTDQDLPHTIESLYRILNHSRHPPEGLASLLEKVKLNHSGSTTNSAVEYANVSHIHSGILQTRDNDDPPGLLETTEVLLRDWLTTYQSTPINKDHSKIFTAFIQQLNLNGVLKSDDLMTRFFRQSIHIVISIYYRALASGEMNSLGRIKVFHTIDGCCKLMAMLVKYSGDSNNFNTKLNLLNKILGVLIGIMLQDSEQRGVDFYHLPYHRIFSMLFMELNCIDDALDTINFPILQAFTHTYHILRPSKVPSFAYAWLELISHRLFINRILLATPQQKGWSMYAQLIIDLFKFLSPFLRNAELAKPVSTLYKGTLRVLLVLLHDFPDFLCDYHFGFCDVIPPNCIQLRNLILSAFPRTMRLPDPFTPNLKVDVLPEIAQPPRILPNYMTEINPPSFKKELDSYLKLRSPVTFLTELRTNLQVDSDIGSSYNISLINSLVLYVGSQAINEIRGKNLNPNMSTIAHSAHMDIFQNLAVDLDLEGRYVFFNAIVNQLRYPNSHTHYFSCVLLYLFSEANAEIIQEQITRILLERIIVNRPHPWGLLITFIELIKNPAYKFWDHDFVHCAPEIEKLFESVANSCMGRKPQSLSSANIENEQPTEQQ